MLPFCESPNGIVWRTKHSNNRVLKKIKHERIKSLLLASREKKYIKVVVEMMKIPSELVLNWDHTGINIVPRSQWTMDP